MPSHKRALRSNTTTAMLAAASFILMYLEIPWPFFLWLKYSPADVPALVGTFAMGPSAGFMIVVLRSAMHFILVDSEPVGHLADVAASGLMVIISGIYYKNWHSRTGAIAGMFAGMTLMVMIMIPVNIYIMIPMFMGRMPDGGMGFDIQRYIAMGVVPFNLFKGLVNVLFTSLVYKRLSLLLPHYGCSGDNR